MVTGLVDEVFVPRIHGLEPGIQGLDPPIDLACVAGTQLIGQIRHQMLREPHRQVGVGQHTDRHL